MTAEVEMKVKVKPGVRAKQRDTTGARALNGRAWRGHKSNQLSVLVDASRVLLPFVCIYP